MRKKLFREKILRGVNADPAALFCNCALACPFAKQTASGEHTNIGEAAQLLVGNVDVNSVWMSSPCAVSKPQESFG